MPDGSQQQAGPGAAPPPGQAPPPRAGYLTPEQEAARRALEEQADRGMNMGTTAAMHRQAEEDAAANAAASGGPGGFKMDVDQMRAILPEWRSIAEKLQDLLGRHERSTFTKLEPAEDQASTTQVQAALGGR